MAYPGCAIERLQHWARVKPQVNALFDRDGGNWRGTNWSVYWQTVRNVGKGLLSLGHKPDECVAILGRNREEWVFAQFGIMAAKGVPAPIYATSTDEQVSYIVNHAKTAIVFAENQEQYDKLARERAKISHVRKVILMDRVTNADPAWTMTFDALLAAGKQEADAALDTRIASIGGSDVAILIYTSGTTGNPKAVIITNDNLRFTARAALSRFALSHSRVISYLPLCHIAEQILSNLLQLELGGEVYFCSELTQLKDLLPSVKPTIFLGVPRVWEKFEAALTVRLQELPGLKGRLMKWARRVELAAFQEQINNGGRPVDSLSRKIANKVLLSKLKGKLGLDQVQFAVTGAAPISKHTLEFFASLGIVIYEAFGLSETSGLLTTTLVGRPKFGTVGTAVDGVTLKIADDGEILAKSPGNTPGYLHDPEATAELLEGGWLHSGDIGEFDADGHLRITDRKKNILITAGGKNVAPQPIEKLLSGISGIGQAVVIGDRKAYLTAVLTVNPETLSQTAASLQISDIRDAEHLARDPRFLEHVQKAIDTQVNPKLARYETIKRFSVIAADFTVENGCMTPTMKVRRKAVIDQYRDIIEGMYPGDEDKSGKRFESASASV